jgi:outer membrane protein assembly factor BamB
MNQSPPVEPVIVSMGRALVAFDQGSGVVRWNYVADRTIERLFRVGGRVLASSGESVVCVDVATGRFVGAVDLGFQPDAGLVCGADLILANGTSGGAEATRVACVSHDGMIRWRATVATAGAENVLRSYGGDGSPRGEIRYARSGYRAGILWAHAVAQPDRE